MNIYIISNNINEKKYVGQTILDPPAKRWYQHLSTVRRQPRSNDTIITKVIRKHGVENFTIEFFPLRGERTQNRLDKTEIRAIREHNSMIPNGYNIREGGSRGAHSTASKLKISTTLTGVPRGPMSQSQKDTLSRVAIGIPHGPMSQSHKDAIHLAKKGVKLSPEHKDSLKGPRGPWSPARRAIGGHPSSKETNKKISDALKGIPQGPMSQASKDALSTVLKGIPQGPMSQVRKDAISAGLRRFYAE